MTDQPTRLPLRLSDDVSSRFLSVIVGSGVVAGLLAAPFLGAQRIPGFEPLIALFSEREGKGLIPISTFLIGLLTLAVQFYAGEILVRRSIRKAFPILFLIVVGSVLCLMLLYLSYVVSVWNELGGRDETFVVGWSRLSSETCGCPPSMDDDECIVGLAFDLSSCWSPRSRLGVRLSLFLSYLVAVEGFAALAGLIVLQRGLIRRQQRKKTPRRPRRRKPPAPGAGSDPAPIK